MSSLSPRFADVVTSGYDSQRPTQRTNSVTMANSHAHFDDEVHIRTIRKLLWCGREFGRASVMVGAGMSLNADKARASAPPFALWSNLARTMYAELNAKRVEDLDPGLYVDPIQVAGEYAHILKRPALDELLLKAIPDIDYIPGRLHKMLLSLPWSDVYTTNYDTLLERTLPSLLDRKYDVINTQSDLVGRMKPRIVKLHGSFPSYRPFIITPEDYRTYPRQFAAFVNTVQQSIMENAFCLLGFSGDDPNFKAWTGWVRDNLGDTAPPIYFCGVLDLSLTNRASLEKKGVTPIDLGQVFRKSEWPNPAVRHAMALEWLLLSLANGETIDPREWPHRPDARPGERSQTRSAGLVVDPIPNDEAGSVLSVTQPATDSATRLRSLADSWATLRKHYPGWIVCPSANREILKFSIQNHDEVASNDESAPGAIERLNYFFELNWRLEKLLYPLALTAETSQEIATALEEIHPDPAAFDLSTAAIRPDRGDGSRLSWARIVEQWCSLAFALVRHFREIGDSVSFERWLERLRLLSRNHPAWNARCSYEQCMFHLVKLQQQKLRAALDQWVATPSLPFWELRRAAILTELGDFTEAARLAETALDHIRTQIRPFEIDYEVMSQEASAMILLRTIVFEQFDVKRPALFMSRKRWAQLHSHDCDPEVELKNIHQDVKAVELPREELVKEFDPGSYTIRRRMVFNRNAYAGYQLLRLVEESALAYRCGHTANYSKAIGDAAELIFYDAPAWAFSALVRADDEERIKRLFDRSFVVGMAPAHHAALFEQCIQALEETAKMWAAKSAQVRELMRSLSWRIARCCCELLSRLAVVMTAKQRKEALSLACALYASALFRNYFQLHSPLESLFQRLLQACSDEEVVEAVGVLLSLPVPEWNGFHVSDVVSGWPEPLGSQGLRVPHLKPFARDGRWAQQVAHLLVILAQGSNMQARDRATRRLLALHYHGGLVPREEQILGQLLWDARWIDPSTRLPATTRYLYSACLTMPGSDRANAVAKFRNWALDTDLPPAAVEFRLPPAVAASATNVYPEQSNELQLRRHVKSIANGTLFPWSLPEQAKHLIDWSSHEAIAILVKLEGWLARERSLWAQRPTLFFRDREDMLDDISNIVAYVILPRIDTTNSTDVDRVRRALDELIDLGANAFATLPGALLIDDSQRDSVAARLIRGLLSTDQRSARCAADGIFYWIAMAFTGRLILPPQTLLDELVNNIVVRRQPALRWALDRMSSVVRAFSMALTSAHIDQLAMALEFLIEETDVRQDTNGTQSSIPSSERAEYRMLSAELAAHLFIFLNRVGLSVPPILMTWRSVAAMDPLPEVRQSWKDIEAESDAADII